MEPATVFVASSTEGLPTADALTAALQAQLGAEALVRPWDEQFALSGTYIESLEQAANRADFAVFAFTADDQVRSRGKAQAAPRDNVVFELGLFMGRIERERCFIVVQRRAGVKVPSDLLGVHVAEFDGTPGPDTLRGPAAQIALQMRRLRGRDKPGDEARAAEQAERRLAERLYGAWWECMWSADASVVSYFEITRDPVRHELRLDGHAYDGKGSLTGDWHSVMVRLDPATRRLEYHWEGRHYADAETRHGYGRMSFYETSPPLSPFTRGEGSYWNVDEKHPERTCMRSLQARRASEDEARQMRTLSRVERCTLARRVYEAW